jgi:hypothetical protein
VGWCLFYEILYYVNSWSWVSDRTWTVFAVLLSSSDVNRYYFLIEQHPVSNNDRIINVTGLIHFQSKWKPKKFGIKKMSITLEICCFHVLLSVIWIPVFVRSLQTIPITEVGKYYRVTEDCVNLDAYSGFRPVFGDGECFYRSFIFSYLEISLLSFP